MPRPPDLPPPEHYAHGTRARYVAGCRCTPCRASNTRYYHERQARAKALAAAIDVDAGPVEQLWTAPDGTKKVRVYKRACPGPGGGVLCPRSSHLRKDSKGGVCRACRELLVWNGNVWAADVRAHIRKLGRAGVGYKSVAEACDVAFSIVQGVMSGRKKFVRLRTAQKILAVTRDAVADHALVDAAPTWKLVDELYRGGFTLGEIALRLGHKRAALQIGKARVLAKTAHQVKRLHAVLMAAAQHQREVDARAAAYRAQEEAA